MDEENLSEFLIGDPPPLIFTQISSLKKLAMLQLATTVCHCTFRRVLKWDMYKFDIYRGTPDFISDVLNEESFLSYTEHDEESLYVYVLKRVIPHLPLPLILRDILKRYVYYVIVKVEKWANYHRCKIFHQRKNYTHIYNYVNEIVWKSDGEINWRETAIKMLSNANISEMEKFRIMAYYCLEECFKGVPLSLEFEKELLFRDEPISYWYKVVKGYSPSLGDKIDLKRFEWGNIHAFLYFWSRLNKNRQIVKAAKLVKRDRENSKYLRGMLLKMNEAQQCQILVRVGKEIVCNFSRTSRYFRYGVLVWMHIREFIKEEQYVKLIVGLLIKYNCDLDSVLKSMYLSTDAMPYTLARNRRFIGCHPDFIEFLTFLYRTAPDRVKRQCLDVETGTGIFTHFSSRFNFEVGILVSVFLNILPTTEANHRRNVFDGIIRNLTELEDRETFDRLLMSTREPRLLDKFLTLCLANADEEATFKVKWISQYTIINHCSYLIANGRFRDFDEFIIAYSPEMIDLVKFKIELLTKMLSGKFWCDVYKKVNYYKPVPKNLKIFCSDIETEVLIDVLNTFEPDYGIDILFSLLVELLPDMNADLRRNILGNIISKQGSKAVFFEELMVNFRRPILLDKFIRLCLLDVEDEVTAFKSKWINPEWITKHCLYLIEADVWESLDEFLTLYLPHEDVVGDYKIQLLNSEPAIKILLKQLLCNEKYDRMNKIISVVFPRANSAEEFRKQLLLRSDAITDFYYMVNNGHIDVVKNCLGLFLQSDEHVGMMKKTILRSVCAHQLPIKFFHCDDFQWSLFVRWFLEDDESSNEFKNSLDLHGIFSKLLGEECQLLIENTLYQRGRFYALDRFLHWYFGSPEKVKEFKTEQIFKYQSIPIINNLEYALNILLNTRIPEFQKDHLKLDRKKYCLSEILWWFFGNDGDLIRRFESAYSSHDIVKASYFMSIRRE